MYSKSVLAARERFQKACLLHAAAFAIRPPFDFEGDVGDAEGRGAGNHTFAAGLLDPQEIAFIG